MIVYNTPYMLYIDILVSSPALLALVKNKGLLGLLGSRGANIAL